MFCTTTQVPCMIAQVCPVSLTNAFHEMKIKAGQFEEWCLVLGGVFE